MSEQEFVIKDGAWLIADSHYARYNTALYDFLSKIEPKNLPPQLILMGDIFDLLFGYAKNSIQPNQKMVDLLKQIAKECEVIYLEGNHDFGLKPIFGGIARVVPRSSQPIFAKVGQVRVALHHGDLFQGIGYEVYTALIRSPIVNIALNFVDILTKGAIIGWLESYNQSKKPCYKIDDFNHLLKKRLELLSQKYSFDYWIDGHFHQGVGLKYKELTYFNIPALSCDKSFFVVRLLDGLIEFEKRSIR